MGPEAMFICDVANLPEHAMLVLVTIAALHLHWVVTFLLLPLLVAFVINHLVAVFVGVVFVFVMLLMMLDVDGCMVSKITVTVPKLVASYYLPRLGRKSAS